MYLHVPNILILSIVFDLQFTVCLLYILVMHIYFTFKIFIYIKDHKLIFKTNIIIFTIIVLL